MNLNPFEPQLVARGHVRVSANLSLTQHGLQSVCARSRQIDQLCGRVIDTSGVACVACLGFGGWNRRKRLFLMQQNCRHSGRGVVRRQARRVVRR